MSPFIIMSAFRQGLSQEENLRRHALLDAALDTLFNVNLKVTLGSGVEESTGRPGLELGVRIEPREGTSFAKVVKDALRMAEHFEQDSILVVDYNGLATLVYRDGRPDEAVGSWTRVSQAEAANSPYWTSIGGAYYVAASAGPTMSQRETPRYRKPEPVKVSFWQSWADLPTPSKVAAVIILLIPISHLQQLLSLL